MPSMSYEDDLPFHKTKSHCAQLGVTADTFWRLPGVLRSDNNHAFAAVGPQAERITAPHPIDIPTGWTARSAGPTNWTGRCYCWASTTARIRPSTCARIWRESATGGKYLTILKDGEPVRFEYREIDHCCQNFSLVDGWLDERGLQRRGEVGNAEARLIRSQDIVEVDGTTQAKRDHIPAPERRG